MAKINDEAGRMFAVISGDDRMPVFVKEGYVGFWPCGPDKYYGWAVLHSNQGDVVTEAALRGSMFGWSDPTARAAVQWQGTPSVGAAAAPDRSLAE